LADEETTQDQERGLVGHYFRGLGSSTKQNSLAYGYSLALTGAFGMLTAVDRSPHVVDIFLFALGGGLTFTIANVLVTRGYRTRVPEEPAVVLALGASFGFFSVVGSLGATWLVAWALEGWTGWFLGPFVASSVYLALTSGELLLARGLRHVAGIEKMEDP
jgi:hypothetical protein